MVYREVTMMETHEVLRQWLAGASMKTIARRLGVDRNTVRRYLRVAARCGLSPSDGVAVLTEEKLAEVMTALKGAPRGAPGEGWARCRQQQEFIRDKLSDGLKLTKVRKLLLRQGIDVSYSTLYRFAVEVLDFGRRAATIPVADGKPGEELQLDTGWMGHLLTGEDGKRRRFRAFIFTAALSRHRFVHACFRETTLDAIEACEEAWAFFGGVFRVLIPDNTKAIVQKPDALAPTINPTFLEYAQARGFVIDPARSRHPRDKARVERAVQPTRDDCYAGEELVTIAAARERGRVWSSTEYGMRRHSRTLRLPLEHFEAEEKEHLLPAPTAPYEVPLWCEPKVAPDQHAQVDRALYSLPRRFRGKTLRARADRHTVCFYLGTELVKTHVRARPGGRSTDPADFPPEKVAYALRDTAFLESKAATHGAGVGRFAKVLLGGPLPWTRMRSVYALLGLCRRFGDDRVEEACARAIEADMFDVRRLGRMLELAPPREASPAPAVTRVLPLSRYLRPPTQYTLPFAGSGRRSAEKGEPR